MTEMSKSDHSKYAYFKDKQYTKTLQVNLFQKHLFLPQLTHNMAKDFSLNYKFSTLKFQAQNMSRTCCAHKLF